MLDSEKLLQDLKQMDYSARANKVRQAFPDYIDALVITHLTNVRYITGFTGSNGLVLLTKEKMLFITDGRYKLQSTQQLHDGGVDAEICTTSQGEGPFEFLEKAISGVMKVGLESTTISWDSATKYINKFVDTEFIPTVGIVESVRKIKEPSEVDRIRTACRIADDALMQTLPMLKDFPTEKQFARQLDRTMVDLGADGNSFDTIAACGPRGALPHAMPTDMKVQSNQLMVIDFGCMVDGYCSDMTRTISVGEPDDNQIKMYDHVIESQRLGREFVKAGVKISDIDSTCRNYLVEQGVGQYFTHSTGHGVGLDIHEEPWVRSTGDETAAAGHILTVEPGIYIEDVAGVRIEDTLHVSDGGAEVLTCAPKTLLVS